MRNKPHTAKGLEIEHDVSMPVVGRSHYPFGDMDIGDSLFLEGVAGVRMANAAANYAARHPVKFSSRSMDGGKRLWRIE